MSAELIGLGITLAIELAQAWAKPAEDQAGAELRRELGRVHGRIAARELRRPEIFHDEETQG